MKRHNQAYVNSADLKFDSPLANEFATNQPPLNIGSMPRQKELSVENPEKANSCSGNGTTEKHRKTEIAFGRIPHEWSRDPGISPEGLCMLAYRCTIGDDRSKYGLTRAGLAKDPLLKKGFSQGIRERAIEQVVKSGQLRRTVRRTRGHPEHGGWFSDAVDKLALPDDMNWSNSELVYRGWFDGTLTCKEMAALLYLRCGSIKGREIYAREVTERFGWCRGTTNSVLRALERRGLIEKIKRRDERGQIEGVKYLARHDLDRTLPVEITDQATKSSTVENSSNDITSDDVTSDGENGALRSIPSTDVSSPLRSDEMSPKRSISSHTTRVAADGDDRAGCGTFDNRAVSTKEVRPLSPERRILRNWRKSPYFEQHDYRFCGEATPPFDLATWRFWLDRFGGAPANLQNVQAHRHASEIAHELAAISAETNDECDSAHWMIALAYKICCDHDQGKEIHTLALPAEPLVRETLSGFTDWAYSVPLPAGDDFETALQFGEMAVQALESFTYGIEIDRNELMSTLRIDALRQMIERHTRRGVIDAINHVTSNRLGHDQVICGWRYFENYIGVANTAAAEPTPAEPPMPTERKLPGDPITVIRKADNWSLMAPGLLCKGRHHLAAYLESRAEALGVDPVDVFDALVAVLSSVDATRYCDKQDAVKSLTAGSSTNARTRIREWCYLDQPITEALGTRKAA